MQNKGIFIFLREQIRFKGTKRDGQIATFIILLLAIVTLLMTAMINFSNVASKKAMILNAAAGASLQIASNLGSYAHMLSCKYLHCKAKRCKFSWKAVVYIVVAVICAIIAVFFWPAWYAVGFLIAAIVLAVMSVLQVAVFDPRMIGAMNRAFRKMDTQTMISESAVRYAFMNTVTDQAMVADMDDMDMDDKFGFKPGTEEPEDLLSRFYYCYMHRLLFLIDCGPAPSDQYYSFTSRLKELVDCFLEGQSCSSPPVSYLRDFQIKASWLSELIGPIPKPTGEPGAQPEPPSFENPQDISNLYDLFAFFQKREYEEINSPGRQSFQKSTQPELYHLSYGAAGNVNIWTEDICEPQEEPEAADGVSDTDPCLTNAVNDDLDAFALSLYNFDYTPDPPDGCGFASEEEEEFIGFAPSFLCSANKVGMFESNWYKSLYNEKVCLDDPEPEEGQPCQNEVTDYNDYYDQINDAPDKLETPYIVEKGWKETLTDWLSRLNNIKSDIDTRARSIRTYLGVDDLASSPRYWKTKCAVWQSNCDGIQDKCNRCVELYRLEALKAKVDWVLNGNPGKIGLVAFKDAIDPFRSAIYTLHTGYQALLAEQPEANPDATDEEKLYDKLNPEYIWYDSLGRHSIKVQVAPFRLPRLHSYRRGCCTHCTEIRNHSGNPSVTVTRRDQPSTAKFYGGSLLWKFQYPVISYTVTAHYSYTATPPGITRVRRNDEGYEK